MKKLYIKETLGAAVVGAIIWALFTYAEWPSWVNFLITSYVILAAYDFGNRELHD